MKLINRDRESFPEDEYLRAYPDVVKAIASGEFTSGWDHFVRHGKAEGRRLTRELTAVRTLPAREILPQMPPQAPQMPRCTLENVLVSFGGGIFVVGWVDDAGSKLVSITVEAPNVDPIVLDGAHLARARRRDVEAALASGRLHTYGFWGFFSANRPLSAQEYRLTVHLSNGASQTALLQASAFDDAQLRDIVLTHFAAAEYFGNPHIEALLRIGGTLGRELVAFNKALSRRMCAAPYVESFNKRTRKAKGSIIVCLYGRPEFLFVQSALFSQLPGIDDYEFIYVCNSPELAERLLTEGRIGKSVYGLDQTLVLLSGNAGFGAANNAASHYAASNRFLIMNPDIFPHDPDWARKHTHAVESLPAHQTALFGVPLYYDDGSLMHAGMYFDIDSVPFFGPSEMTRQDFVRVEHYGKGVPANTLALRKARPVPAISGAFMSVDRRCYERIGGFTEDFIFGHYEDADFCLKAAAAQTTTWLHDIGMWHLEGKGSTRLPVHEGGSLINRWLFSATWGTTIKDRLKGGTQAGNGVSMEDKGPVLALSREASPSQRRPVSPS